MSNNKKGRREGNLPRIVKKCGQISRHLVTQSPCHYTSQMTQMRWLKLAGILLLATAVVIIILITSGYFDPKPVGNLVWESEPIELVVEAGSSKVIWLTDLPDGDFSLHTAVRYQSGELDSAAGIVLGNDCPLKIAISPLDYATIQQLQLVTDNCSSFTDLPWQPWPHIKTGNTPNEIWVDLSDGELQVRLNRELMWVGVADSQPTTMGITGESFGGTAVYTFQQIDFFTESE